MSPHPLALGEDLLALAQLDACLGRPLSVDLSRSGLERAARARGWVEGLLAAHEPIYGINTGFGHLKNKRVPEDRLDELQENLLLSHAVGVGPATPVDITRWMLAFKVHMLLIGHSGVRPEIITQLAALLNHDLIPVVPTRGSLGASGDLAPLAHLCLPLLGRGEFHSDGGPVPAETGLSRAGLSPLKLASKEGLALINGTQFMSAYAAQIGVRAIRLADLADLALCLSLEGMCGSIRPAERRLHQLRPHPGAQRVAANIRAHMAGSEILASHQTCPRVQDPYSFRCAPQVHGAFRDTLTHFCSVVETEINSVTDNPILFEDTAISGGNFHGAPLAAVLDFLAIALTDLASIAERRIYTLLSGEDDLPKLLMLDTGLNSGFMLPQYTAAALVNECKVLATPASIDSIPTSLGQEDHVSMGATSALKCYEVLDRVETVTAIELMCAAQAIDYRAPLQPGVGPRDAHALIRRRIPHAEHDRQFGLDIATSLDLLRHSAELRDIARRASAS